MANGDGDSGDLVDRTQRELEESNMPGGVAPDTSGLAPAPTAGAPPEGDEGLPAPTGGTEIDQSMQQFLLMAQAMLAANSTGPDDETVVTGFRQVFAGGPDPELGGSGQNAPRGGRLSSSEQPTRRAVSLEPTEAPVAQVARDIFAMPEDRLHELQVQLFAAGFYGSADFDEVQWDQPGPDTYAAFSRFLQHASLWMDSQGDRQPWWKVLDELSGTGDELQENLAEREPTTVVRLTDPAGLRQTFDAAQRSVLGRKMSTTDQRAFVAMVHDLERRAQTTAADLPAQGGGTVELFTPQVEAQAVEFARAQAPELAQAHDATRQYESFLNIIGGRR